MKLGIQLHVAGLSLLKTIPVLDDLGVQRSSKAVHDWVQKADLQPDGGASQDHAAVDESVIRINDLRYERHGNRNGIERVYREVKRRTSSLSNCFSHVQPSAAENWLQTFAVWHNATN